MTHLVARGMNKLLSVPLVDCACSQFDVVRLQQGFVFFTLSLYTDLLCYH